MLVAEEEGEEVIAAGDVVAEVDALEVGVGVVV